MASNMYNTGKSKFLLGEIDWVDDGTATNIRLLLVDDTHTPEPDDDYVADVVGDEAAGTGYVRKNLASCAVSVNDTDDRAEADAADVTWTGLDCGTIAAAIVYKFITNDAASVLICHLDFTDLVTNGGDVTLQFAAAGLFYV